MALLLLLTLITSDDSLLIVRSSWAWDADACTSSLHVRRPELFRSDCRVVVHVPVCRHRTSSDRHTVGSWSWNVIDTIIGNHLYLRYRLPDDVVSSEHIQVTRAIEPPDENLNGRVVPQPWDGYDGGIIAIWSDDTLTIDASVTATGMGYIQPLRAWNTGDTSSQSLETIGHYRPGTGGGPCSIVQRSDISTSWLAPTTAGSPHNSGGAGGASAGAGGGGGTSSSVFASVSKAQGLPGRPSDDGTRLVFGSSGASGHGNDLDAGRGGRGGGIVIIRARHLRLTRASVISADGTNGHDAGHDAGGGGGGAGMILFDAVTIEGGGLISVRGGHGGSTHSTLFACGPGGGGGGGSVLSTVPMPAAVRLERTGGSAGDADAQFVPDSSIPNSAERGADGALATSVAPWNPVAGRVQRMLLRGSDSVVPFGSRTTLWSEGASRTQWLDDVEAVTGDSVRTSALESGRWYRARLTGDDGCSRLDSIYVRVIPSSPNLIVSIGDLRARPGDSVDIYLNVRSTSTPSRTIEGIAYVSTHPNVLLPIGASARVSRGRTRIEFPFRLNTSTGTYRRDQLQAVLGDSAAVQLSIDSVRLTDPSINVQRRHGRFTLDGVCMQDGRRRMFSDTPTYSIRGRSITTVADEVLISDVLGRPIAHHRTIDDKGLTVEIDPDLDGLVFVIFISHTSMLTVPLWLQRASGL
jgi:hypothetical protein